MRALIVIMCFLAACSTAPRRGLDDRYARVDIDAAARLIDLTYPFDRDTIFWPTEKGFDLERQTAGVTPGGWYYSSNKFCTPEHGGTHIDAPLHFNATGQSVDTIPVERFVGPAVVVDVSAAA